MGRYERELSKAEVAAQQRFYQRWAAAAVRERDRAVEYPASRILACTVGCLLVHPGRRLHRLAMTELGAVVGLSPDEVDDAIAELVERGHLRQPGAGGLTMIEPPGAVPWHTLDDLRVAAGGKGSFALQRQALATS